MFAPTLWTGNKNTRHKKTKTEKKTHTQIKGSKIRLTLYDSQRGYSGVTAVSKKKYPKSGFLLSLLFFFNVAQIKTEQQMSLSYAQPQA